MQSQEIHAIWLKMNLMLVYLMLNKCLICALASQIILALYDWYWTHVFCTNKCLIRIQYVSNKCCRVRVSNVLDMNKLYKLECP